MRSRIERCSTGGGICARRGSVCPNNTFSRQIVDCHPTVLYQVAMLVSLIAEVRNGPSEMSRWIANSTLPVCRNLFLVQIRKTSNQHRKRIQLRSARVQQRHHRRGYCYHRLLRHGGNRLWCWFLLPCLLAKTEISQLVYDDEETFCCGDYDGHVSFGSCEHCTWIGSLSHSLFNYRDTGGSRYSRCQDSWSRWRNRTGSHK